MEIRTRIICILCLLPAVILISCSNDDDVDDNEENTEIVLTGTWSLRSDLDAVARSGASSFTIENKGYIAGGYDGRNRLSDLWEYNMDADYWTQKADLPGMARNMAVAFAVEDKGYFGTGYDGSEYLNDFWEYDPLDNSWTQTADFPGSARYEAVAFGLSGKGYVGCGYDGNYLKDFYSFDPTTNSWEQISFEGSKRTAATGFIIDDLAYVFCGDNNGVSVEDCWKYNPSEDLWDQVYFDSSSGILTGNGYAAFVIDGLAYLTAGINTGSIDTCTWKYDPKTDLWEEVAQFGGTLRTKAVSFSNGERGYIATGSSTSTSFDDLWEFSPNE